MITSILIAFGIIYNTLRVSFSERSWELASLRVLGFSKADVSRTLLTEVGAQVIASLIPGCLIGAWLTHLSLGLINTEAFTFPVVIENATFARGILAVLLASITGSFMIDRAIGHLRPTEALKARE
jgi:putative ABC transport system permease protein